MYKSILFFIFSIFISVIGYGQNKLNNYSTVLIPEQFSFQNKPNQYNINNLLKVSFKSYDFTAFIKGDIISKEIEPCDILTIDILKTGILSTKLRIVFSDCYGKNIHTSIEGKSRRKDFKLSFYEALGKALKDIDIQQHHFTSSKTNSIVKTQQQQPSKISNYFNLTLKNKTYKFLEVSASEYKIFLNDDFLGTARKEQNTDTFIMDAKSLSGTGTFDDFGNFMIVRTNPLNQQVIKDTMLRVF